MPDKEKIQYRNPSQQVCSDVFNFKKHNSSTYNPVVSFDIMGSQWFEISTPKKKKHLMVN